MPPKKVKKTQFEPKDLVLAKMHGFPAWPSFVMPEDMVPDAILKAKKKTTNYCVIFIPDGDFYWMSDKNLEPLSEEKLDKKLEKIPNKNKPKKKAGGRTLQVTDALLATKGLDFDDFMERLDKDRIQGDEEDEEVEGYEDEEEYDADEISESKKQDGDDEEEKGEGDSLEEDENALSDRNSRSKRKRSISTNGKRKTLKASNTTPTASSQAEYTNGHNKTKVEGSPKLTEEEKQHQLWLCRIKLQRSLIQRNQPVTPANPKQFPPPTANELLVARLILHRLVEFPVNLELLKKTKIHKVLKCILRDKDLEYPDSFKLHEKCEELLAKWNSIIEDLKVEKLKEPNQSLNHNHSSSTTSALTDVKNSESRLSSLAPDESEVSALENITTDSIKKEPANGNSDYRPENDTTTQSELKDEHKDSDDINESITNDVSVIS
ncbi:uncharacterized protein AC631_02519 [Debaryomyces fabryi]|uniref:PWWP domain-containing protein n=1 Tax=Debaryomyces fabryi TaxID=58627 RepID=A0A0V1Q0K7_9ASCO|nr:uncharacterized protein AC631_02519 [Debaryomyces fabryi]KSA01711.1 hypothetical protein AC631_02519 [Debaryomyces fabryi]CUM45252.1 unnamed protein product [Debaryomyces fabryi]